MADLYDSYDTGTEVVSGTFGHQDTVYEGQSFTPAVGFSLASVAFRMYRDTSGLSLINMYLYAADGNGKPTGAALASKTGYDGSIITSSAAWYTITFASPYTVTAGTQYVIVLTTTDAANSKYFTIKGVTSGAYTGGSRVYSLNSGSSWTTTAADHWFRTYGVAVAIPPTTDAYTEKKLWGIGSNQFWYESPAGTMIQFADSVGEVDTSDFISATEAYGKVFVANGTNLKVADFRNIKLTTAGIGANPPDFETVLTGGSSGAIMVVDYITTLSGACTLYGVRSTTDTFTNGETVTGTDDDDNAISFVLSAAEAAGPFWYDWTVFGQDSSFGVMPTTAYDVVTYRGRVCLSVDSGSPNQWYMSRQRNPWNWLYGADDAQSAVRGNDADAGKTGDTVITQIPYKDDFMIHACANTLWYVSGDPAEGGSINELDLTAGILSSRAHAWDDKDNLYLLSTKGLLIIPSGFGPPENLTKDSYPDFIQDIAYDPTLHRLTMGYDRIRDGIIIAKTTLADGTHEGWWYSLRSQGLFPETYPEECAPFSMFWYEADDPDYRDLLLGSNDGYIRYFDDTAKDDNVGASTEAISSYVGIGPITLGGERNEGSLNSLEVVLTGDDGTGSTADSDDVTYKLFVDRSADGAIKKLIANSAPKVSGTITAPGRPLGNMKKKRVRGTHVAIRLENTDASEAWGLDIISVKGSQKGRVK